MKNDLILSISDNDKNRIVETILEIASKYNKGTISQDKLENIGLESIEGINKILNEKSIRKTKEEINSICCNEEFEDAVKVFIDFGNDTGARYIQGYIYYLCKPLIKSMWSEFCHSMKAYKSMEELMGIENEFNAQAYFAFMELLSSHTENIRNKKAENTKRGFIFLLKCRIYNKVYTEITRTEFAEFRIYKSSGQRKCDKLIREFYKENGYEPSDAEIAKIAGVKEKTVKRNRIMMDKAYDDEADTQSIELVEERLVTQKEDTVFEEINERFICEKISEKLDHLHRKALLMRLGYNDDKKEYSFRRIAKELCLSPYKVRILIDESLEIMHPFIT